MVPLVKDNNPLGIQKTISLDFDEEGLVRSARETLKISKLFTLNQNLRRYMAEILPIRRKTLSNQSLKKTDPDLFIFEL